MDPLTVLLFCCDILERRQLTDRDEGWFWAMRLKVALFRLRMELRKPQHDDIQDLTWCEKQLILDTHPLLAHRRMNEPVSSPDCGAAWLDECRNRIRTHLGSISSRRESN